LETWEAINSIRVVRDFSARPLPEEHVMRIIDAGRRAGSSKNMQRWAFVVLRDRDRLAELAKAGPWAGHIAGASVAIALVTPDPKGPDQPLSVMWDLGRAAQNMVLAAWDLGIGSAPATAYHPEVVGTLLKLPDDHHCEFVLSFGYPADESELKAPKRAGGRLTREEVLHQELW
jgi:nitroreductase